MLRSSALLVCAALILAACDSSVQAPATEQDERVLDRSSLPSLESYFEYSATAGKNEKYACAVAIRLKNGKIITRVKPMAVPKEFASVGGTRKVLYALRDQNGAVLRIAECAIPDSDLIQSWLVESALRLPAELRSANSATASKAAETGLICSWDPVFNGYVCEDQIVVTPGNEGDLLGDPDMPDRNDWPYYELPPYGGGGGSTGGGTGSNSAPVPMDASSIQVRFESTCLSGVYNAIGGESAIAQMINAFAQTQDANRWNLTFTEGSSSFTTWTSGTQLQIQIQSPPAGRTPTSVARTMLHEALHAYLMAWAKWSGQEFLGTSFEKLIALHSYYAINRKAFSGTDAELQNFIFHNHIADYYLGQLSSSLQAWAGTYGGVVAPYSEFWNDMAWGGLTQQSLKFAQLPSAVQSRINDTINNESDGGSRGPYIKSASRIRCGQ